MSRYLSCLRTLISDEALPPEPVKGAFVSFGSSPPTPVFKSRDPFGGFGSDHTTPISQNDALGSKGNGFLNAPSQGGDRADQIPFVSSSLTPVSRNAVLPERVCEFQKPPTPVTAKTDKRVCATDLRAARGQKYRFTGCVWPATGSESLLLDALLRRLRFAGVSLSSERGQLVWWCDQSSPDDLRAGLGAHHLALSDGVANWSVEAGIIDEPTSGPTSRWCAQCEAVAMLADYHPLLRDEGRWLCERCFESADHPRRPERHRRPSSAPISAPPILLNHVERNAEAVRLDWWKQPVAGWSDRKLTLHNMMRDETVEFPLEDGE